MGRFLGSLLPLFRHGDGTSPQGKKEHPSSNGTKKDGYVSEFTQFMDEFLRIHPEAVKDQYVGWNIYWNKKVDFSTLSEAEEDTVPAETFYYYGYGNPPKHQDGGQKEGRRPGQES